MYVREICLDLRFLNVVLYYSCIVLYTLHTWSKYVNKLINRNKNKYISQNKNKKNNKTTTKMQKKVKKVKEKSFFF